MKYKVLGIVTFIAAWGFVTKIELITFSPELVSAQLESITLVVLPEVVVLITDTPDSVAKFTAIKLGIYDIYSIVP